MENGLNNYLKKISSELFIKKGSLERFNICRSLNIIIDNLKDYFGDEVSKVVVFGSYTRDTILPRSYDEHLDVDIMVEFNTEDYDKLKSESYRSKLKRFADLRYPKALSVKDHPSIVIERDHIKFDLVPSIFDKGWFYDSIEIPGKDGGWIETKPDKFNQKLIRTNKSCNYIVKPIVRLLKYWNASHDYPYSSYFLEKTVAEMDFNNHNIYSGFFYAIKRLPTHDFPKCVKDKVNQLKYSVKSVKHYIEHQEIYKAKLALSNILPAF